MHNMIIKNERDEDLGFNYEPHHAAPPSAREGATSAVFVENYFNIKNTQVHNQLQKDLIVHLWRWMGSPF